MTESLENICRNLLNIDESTSFIDIADFVEKKKIYNVRSLFLINFQGKRAKNLTNPKVNFFVPHEILGFKKFSKKNGENYYHIYCKIGEKNKSDFKYDIYISNWELTRKINLCSYEKIDLKICIPNSPIIFYPRDDKKFNKMCGLMLEKDYY